MAIKATVYGLAKTKKDIDINEQFRSLMTEVDGTGAVVIDGKNIAADSIYANQIKAGQINADHLRTDAITADHIQVGVVTGDKIKTGILESNNNLSWLNMDDGTFSFGGGRLTYNQNKLSITAEELYIGTSPVVTNDQLNQELDKIESPDFENKVNRLSGNPIFTDKADDNAIVHVEVDGKSVGGGSGKNLINGVTEFSTTINGTSYYYSPRDLTIDFASLGGKKVSFSFELETSKEEGFFRIETQNTPWQIVMSAKDLKNGRYEHTTTIPSGLTNTHVQLYATSVTSGTTLKFKKIQLELGDPTPYEPPVPTPDYPIAISSFSDKNLLDTTGAHINCWLTGVEVYPNPTKNALNNSTARKLIKVTSGKTLTLVKDSSPIGADNYWRLSWLNQDFTYVTRTIDTSNKVTITVPADVSYLWVSYPNGTNPRVYRGTDTSPADFDVVSSVGKENLIPDETEGEWKTVSVSATIGAVRGYVPMEHLGLKGGDEISWSIDHELNDYKLGLRFNFQPSNINAIGTVITGSGRANHKAIIPMGTTSINLWLNNNGLNGTHTANFNVRVKNSKIERGNATPYAQSPKVVNADTPNPTIYKTNISLSEPLRSIGDVKDKLFRDTDGLWKVERNIGERVFNGSEPWSMGASSGGWYTSGSTLPFYQYNLNGLKKVNTESLTSHFKTYVGSGLVGVDVEGFSVSHTSYEIFRISSSRLTAGNADAFKAWLANNPVTVHYVLNTPTIETLPDDLQQKLNNIQSYGITSGNVFSTKNEYVVNTSFQGFRMKLKPKKSYTMTTNIPDSSGLNFSTFFSIGDVAPSHTLNGVSNNFPRTIQTDSTGDVSVAVRVGAIRNGLDDGSMWIKIQETPAANYVYTVSPESNEALVPVLHATFKTKAWSNDYKLDHYAQTEISKRVPIGQMIESIKKDPATARLTGERLHFTGDVLFDKSFHDKLFAESIFTNTLDAREISAARIKTGMLQSKNGLSNLNMDNGTFNFGNGKITYDGNNLVLNVDTLQIKNSSVPTTSQAQGYANTAKNEAVSYTEKYVGKIFRAYGISYSYRGNAANPFDGGRIVDEKGNSITPSSDRSYLLAVIDKNDNVVYSNTFDVYTSASNAKSLSDKLNEYDKSYLIILVGSHAPAQNRLSNNLPSTLYSFGASREVFVDEDWDSGHAAYLLVGRKGIGEGNGYEVFSSYSNGGMVDVLVPIKNGATSLISGDNTIRKLANSAQGTANTANTNATNAKSKTDAWTYSGTTEINGGKIRTNTILANAINATTLSAITANLGTVTAGIVKSGNGMTELNLGTGILSTKSLGNIVIGDFPTQSQLSTTLESGHISQTSRIDMGNGVYLNDYLTITPAGMRFEEIGQGSGTSHSYDSEVKPSGLRFSYLSNGGFNGSEVKVNTINGVSIEDDYLMMAFNVGDKSGQSTYHYGAIQHQRYGQASKSVMEFDSNGVWFPEGIQSIRLSANSNLNDIIKTGFYYCPTDQDTKTIANTPMNDAFSLVVERHAGHKQTFTTYKTGSQKTFTRNYYNGSWGSWVQVGSYSHQPTVQEGMVTVSVTANTVSSTVVKFKQPFSNTPRILVSANSGANAFRSVSAFNVSSTGFSAGVFRTDSTNTQVWWMAVEDTSYLP